tara:strand:- start:589 stop:918 length:330 start_codon:yes stop_codon:yes gene_type:complete
MSIKLENGQVYRDSNAFHYEGNFASFYGGKVIRIDAPTPRQLKRAIKRKEAHFYTFMSTYSGNYKLLIQCSGARYLFDLAPLKKPPKEKLLNFEEWSERTKNSPKDTIG